VAHICLPLANVGLMTLLFDFVFAPALDVGWLPHLRVALSDAKVRSNALHRCRL
jgi:hypothetical protein